MSNRQMIAWTDSIIFIQQIYGCLEMFRSVFLSLTECSNSSLVLEIMGRGDCDRAASKQLILQLSRFPQALLLCVQNQCLGKSQHWIIFCLSPITFSFLPCYNHFPLLNLGCHLLFKETQQASITVISCYKSVFFLSLYTIKMCFGICLFEWDIEHIKTRLWD